MKKLLQSSKLILWILFPITLTVLYFMYKKYMFQKINNDKTKLSKTKAELELIAKMQVTYMGNMGTEEKEIFESIEGLNPNDLIELYNIFGEKEYAFGTYQGEMALIGNKLNLLQWYNEELSGEDLAKMREIWKKTGLIF